MLKLHDPKAVMEYYAISCKRGNMTKSIRKLRSKHSQAEVVYHHRKVPATANIYNELRKNKLFKSKRNYCQPITNLATVINEINRLLGPSSNVEPYNLCLWHACDQRHLYFQNHDELSLHQQSCNRKECNEM